MYNTYFGFSKSPFENNLDQEFLFLSEDHKEVLAALLYFIKSKKGFAIVCGDVGTGKTMLINSFLNRLTESIYPIIISNPFVDSREMLAYLAERLEIRTPPESLLALTDVVKKALIGGTEAGKQFVLIVDEAHLLSDQSLEEVRLLSNLETPEHKLLQILLVGQYELSHKLDRLELRPLRQRININRFLSPLNPSETIQYIDHRLKKVGSNFDSCFESNSRRLIFKMTQGTPRRINQLCDSALLICLADRRRKVNRKILKKADEALRTDSMFTPKSPRIKTLLGVENFLRPSVLIAAIVLFLILGGVFGHLGYLGEDVRQFSHKFPPPAGPSTAPKISEPPGSKGGETSADLKVELPRKIEEVPPAPTPDHPAASLVKPGETGALPQTGTPSPPADESKPPVKVAPGAPSPVKTMVAKEGETLTSIAALRYPDSKKTGLEAIILANPQITNEDLIYPGQVLYLPRVDPSTLTIQLRDNLFYALYGKYPSAESLEKEISGLIKKKFRFLVLETKDKEGKAYHRAFIGGYEKEQDLEKALQSLKTK